MTRDIIEEISTTFGLGRPVCAPEPVSGGRLHHVWKVTTPSGEFALKLLNESLMQKENICAAFERSEDVARTFAELGVPAVPAILKDGKCLHVINDRAAMVYEWIEGKAHPVGTVDKQRAAKMGEALGTIHGINLDQRDFKPAYKFLDTDQWTVLIERAASIGNPVAADLKTNAARILYWAESSCNASAVLLKDLILSHGDLDQHNVIWSDDSQPAIIDWESTSLQNSTVELLNLCLDWSGFPDSLPDKEAFLACYEGYRRSNDGKTASVPIEAALIGEFAYFLRWLSFSLERSFGTGSVEEHEIGAAEAANALRSICLLDEFKDTLLSWL